MSDPGMEACRHGLRPVAFRFCRRLLVGWLLLYVVVILTLGGTPAARWVMYGLAALWLAIFSIAVLRPRNSSTPSNNRQISPAGWIDIAATNLAAILVLSEISLRAWAAMVGGSLLVQANLDAHCLVPGHDYGGGLYGNRLGYPGPELPAKKTPGLLRIAALGDSFAVGPTVPFADNYLTRLAVELPGVEVANFGVSGAGPRIPRDTRTRCLANTARPRLTCRVRRQRHHRGTPPSAIV